jgi:prepilin-type N-terminal cleavage/methylation domain-containing protein
MAASPRASNRRHEGGFTLMELGVVTVILAILAAVVTMPGDVDDATAIDLAQIQLNDAFEIARTRAYSLGIPHGVVFDVENNRYAVVAQDGTPTADPLTHGDYVIEFSAPGQHQGLRIQFADFGITGSAGIFDGQGVPVASGLVTLANNDESRTFQLDPATGTLAAADG